jgi:hypothetical protein
MRNRELAASPLLGILDVRAGAPRLCGEALSGSGTLAFSREKPIAEQSSAAGRHVARARKGDLKAARGGHHAARGQVPRVRGSDLSGQGHASR